LRIEDFEDLILLRCGHTDDDDDKEPDTPHLVLAQFDKVTRTKSKWKCHLKDGILRLNGCDYSFQRANGEFDF